MWRISTIGLMLWLAMSAPAQGASEERAEPRGRADVQANGAVAGKAALTAHTRLGSMQLQLSGALAFVEPSLRARAGSARRPLGSGMHDGRLPRFKSDAGPLLIYALSPRMSLGLRYRFLTGEDMARLEIAEGGSIRSDYMNHRFVVRAHWHF